MRPSRTVVVAATAVLLAALVVYLVRWSPLAADRETPPSSPTATSSSPISPSGTPTSTPTPHDATPTATVTAPGGEESAKPAPTADDRQAVTVVVTYSGWDTTESVIEVGAYAATLDGGGTCTLRLTNGSLSASVSGATLTDVSTMSCGRLTVARSDVSSGTWTGVVSYDSATGAGTSDPVEVVVP